MNVHVDPIDATEYVLALLDRDERKAFEAALLDDPALARAVWEAEEALAPLALAVKGRPVSRRVKRAILGRIFGDTLRERRSAQRRLRFWRGVAGLFGTVSVAALAGLAVLAVRPEAILPPEPTWVAAIVRADGTVSLARLRDDGRLVAEAFQVAETDGDPELWLVPDEGTPVSLGVLGPERSQRAVEDALRRVSLQGAQLVVTLEPEGGSPTGGPTGPALGAGALTQI